MPEETPDNPIIPTFTPLKFKDATRTLRLALRVAWDNVAMVMLSSVILTLATLAPIGITYRVTLNLNRSLLATVLSVIISVIFVTGPLYGAIATYTMGRLRMDSPTISEVMASASKSYWRAVRLAAMQTIVAVIMGANLLFYLRAKVLILLLPGVVSLYLLRFWWMMSLYQWSLFVASENGTIPSETGKIPGLKSIVRNSLVMAAGSPIYSSVVLFGLCLISVPCVLTGAGAAVLLPGIVAFCTSQATIDQLVLFGTIVPLPDPDEEILDLPWRVKE